MNWGGLEWGTTVMRMHYIHLYFLKAHSDLGSLETPKEAGGVWNGRSSVLE